MAVAISTPKRAHDDHISCRNDLCVSEPGRRAVPVLGAASTQERKQKQRSDTLTPQDGVKGKEKDL